MRIGFDYLTAVCHAPGVGRYGRELVRALVRRADCPELALFEVGGGERTMEGAPLGLEAARPGSLRRLRARIPRRVIQLAARGLGLGADRLLGGVDLFHRSACDYPPVSRAPEVLPIPELPAAGTPADAALAEGARRASAVVVFSEHYARLVARRYELPAERIHLTPVGCEHWLRDWRAAQEVSGSPPSAAPTPPERARILALGALRHERSPAILVDGYTRWIEGGGSADLLLIGRTGEATADFEAARARSSAAERIRWIREPVEAEMSALVAGSSLLVHLDREAGTPVTPLEAMAMGLPVVARQLPAYREALGQEAVWVEELEARAVAAAIEAGSALASDAAARVRRLARAGLYTWDRCAEATLEVWRRHAAR